MRRSFALLLLLFIFGWASANAGELGSIRKDLHSESGSSSNSRSSGSKTPDRHTHRSSGSNCSNSGWLSFGSSQSSDSSNSSDDDTTSFTGLLAAAGIAGVTSPLWGPHAALSDDLSRETWFPKHPYQKVDGAIAYDHAIPGTHDNLVVFQGVYGTNLDSLDMLNGRAMLENRSRFGIDTEFNYRTERLPADQNDSLWNGDFNLTYRFAQSENWLFRAGLGLNWLTAHGQDDYGFNFTYGAEWFPVEPLVVTGTIDWGKIGSAGLFHGRTTVGITKSGWGVFTGYDLFRVSDNSINSWITGIELRY